MKRIIITYQDQIRVEVKNASVSDFTNMCLSAILAVYKQALDVVPDQNKKDVKTHLFDLLNEAASEALASFAPEIDMRPDITEDALLIAELHIQEEVNKLLNENQQLEKKLEAKEVGHGSSGGKDPIKLSQVSTTKKKPSKK